jgi:hypothetical protein
VVINAEIPLVFIEAWKIYKVVPLPVIHANAMMIAVVKNEYLEYNFKSDSYITLSSSEIKDCEIMEDRHFVCRGSWPWALMRMHQNGDANANLLNILRTIFWSN